MRNQKIFDMTVMSVFLVIIIIMASVPQLGFIDFPLIPGVGFTLIHIPVIVASIYFGIRIGGFAGFVFGVASFIVAWIRPIKPLDPLFRNPLISIFPRVAFAMLSVPIYKFFNKFISKKYLSLTFSAVISTIIHTALVVPLLGLFGASIIQAYYGLTNVESVMMFIKATFIFNGIAETILAALIVPPIIIALDAANLRATKKNIILDE